MYVHACDSDFDQNNTHYFRVNIYKLRLIALQMTALVLLYPAGGVGAAGGGKTHLISDPQSTISNP
jgi:hypothetical protein